MRASYKEGGTNSLTVGVTPMEQVLLLLLKYFGLVREEQEPPMMLTGLPLKLNV